MGFFPPSFESLSEGFVFADGKSSYLVIYSCLPLKMKLFLSSEQSYHPLAHLHQLLSNSRLLFTGSKQLVCLYMMQQSEVSLFSDVQIGSD